VRNSIYPVAADCFLKSAAPSVPSAAQPAAQGATVDGVQTFNQKSPPTAAVVVGPTSAKAAVVAVRTPLQKAPPPAAVGVIGESTTPVDLLDADEVIAAEKGNVIDFEADIEVEDVSMANPLIKFELVLETKFKHTAGALHHSLPDFLRDNEPERYGSRSF